MFSKIFLSCSKFSSRLKILSSISSIFFIYLYLSSFSIFQFCLNFSKTLGTHFILKDVWIFKISCISKISPHAYSIFFGYFFRLVFNWKNLFHKFSWFLFQKLCVRKLSSIFQRKVFQSLFFVTKRHFVLYTSMYLFFNFFSSFVFSA